MKSCLAFLILVFIASHSAQASTTAVNYWKLDDDTTSTSMVTDSSGNSNHGTNHNATTSASVPPRILFSNPGSLIFNSTNSSYIDLPGTGLVGGGATWTICLWFKTTSSSLQQLYSEANVNSGSLTGAVAMDVNATAGKVRLFVRDDNSAHLVDLPGSATVNDGNWHLACGVKNSSSNYGFYLDNTAHSSVGTTVNIPTLDRHAIGANKRGTITSYFTGNIDDVRLYDRALSVSELTSIYNGVDIDFAGSGLTSSANSTVVAGSSNVVANGTATTSITVTIKDASNSPLAGETVSLSSSRGGSDTINPSTGVTDSNGIVTFVASSSLMGQSVYTASVGATTVTQTATVNYTGIKTETGVTYTSTLDNLSLKMDVSYNNGTTSLPILLILSGYGGPYSGSDINQRLAQKGVFAIKIYKRGYNSSQGIQDDGAREVYDLYDAVEYVKSNYSQYVDSNNVNVMGWSGGGGNAYSLATKFPDYFRSINSFFGISDYCHDPTYSYYYNSDQNEIYNPQVNLHITGNINTQPSSDQCYARASHLGAGNNPYSQIQLFYDTEEAHVPMDHASQYTDNAVGLTNVVTRITDSNSTTTEFVDNYSTGISDYYSVGNGSTKHVWNNGGYINFTGDRTSTFSSLYRKFTSLRNYDRTDRIKASFNFTINTNSTFGTIIMGFRNSSNMSFNKDAVSLLLVNSALTVRIDYGDGSLRDLTAFTTSILTGTTYGVDLEMNNSVVTATLKDSNGTTIETQSVNFNAIKGFDGIDSFALTNYSDGISSDTMTGTFDNLNIVAWARWIHGYPQEGTGTPEGNITAENYFIPDIVAGTWDQPTLLSSSTRALFIPGFMRTNNFQIMLGQGNAAAANLHYDISGSASALETAKKYTIQSLTSGDPSMVLTIYDLDINTVYSVKDNDLINSSSTVYQATTDGDGKLTFTGILNGSHRYDLYVYLEPTPTPTPTPTQTPTPTPIISSVSGGRSAQNQIRKLMSTGQYALADQISKQYSKTNTFIEPIKQTLKFGERNDQVKQLQKFLNSQGFIVSKTGAGSPGSETTYFGPATLSALKKFQLKYKKEILDPQGITNPTGFFGIGTMKLMSQLIY